MGKVNYESEAYNSGWLAGFDTSVVELYNGFNGAIPKWLLPVIGGKKVVAEALKSMESDEFDEMMVGRDYDCGEADGYEELLEEVEEAYKKRKEEMPTFLKELHGVG